MKEAVLSVALLRGMFTSNLENCLSTQYSQSND